MKRSTQILLTASAVATLTALVVLAWRLSGRPPGDFVRFRLAFFYDPLGLATILLAASNFALAFLAVTPMTRAWLRRPAAQARPGLVFGQYFLISLTLYELGAVLTFAYFLMRPEGLLEPQAPLLLMAVLGIAGCVKLVLVDAPDVMEVIEEIKDGTAATPDRTP